MATLQALREAGWSLNEQAVAALQAEHGPQALPQALLDADLRQVGAPQLPDDVGRADSKKLAGPMVLQVSSVADISLPSRASGDAGERKGRILRLKLTDGTRACVGVEFSPLAVPTEKLCPGTKLRLRNVTVRVGVLLLEARCLEVLGGRVAELAEAWETQQQFGGAEKERADAADAERPPAFRPWDPKMAKYGSRRGAVAQASAAAAQAGTGAAAAPAAPAAGAAAAGGAGAQQRRRGGLQPYQPPVARQQAGPDQAAPQAPAPGRQQQQRGGRGAPSQQQLLPAAAAPPAPPAAAPQPQAAAAQRLLGRLQEPEGRFGRGQRRGRRRFDDDEDDAGTMTLEEWEARQSGGGGAGGGASQQQQPLTDEELARQLQRQLDLEAAQEMRGHQPQEDLAATLQGMFTYSRDDADDGGYGGGRGGRGRGRGRRGGGGGRGRGRGRGRH